MSFRFITKSIHAYFIDYPFAIVLIAAPFVLKLGQSGPVAMWLSVVVGVAALLLPALTDHPTGLVRIIPYWLHLWVDRAVGVVFVIAPFAFKFTGLDARYYWVLAAGVLLSTSVFNAPEEPVATSSGLDMRTPVEGGDGGRRGSRRCLCSSAAVRHEPKRSAPFLAIADAFDRALIGAHGAALALVSVYLSRAGIVEADEFGRLESSPARSLKRILPRAADGRGLARCKTSGGAAGWR